MKTTGKLGRLKYIAVLLAGCAVPAATSAVAVGVAAHNLEQGRCVSACSPGHRCNGSTGLCEPIPCAGGCPSGEECVRTVGGSRCMPSELELHRQNDLQSKE